MTRLQIYIFKNGVCVEIIQEVNTAYPYGTRIDNKIERKIVKYSEEMYKEIDSFVVDYLAKCSHYLISVYRYPNAVVEILEDV